MSAGWIRYAELSAAVALMVGVPYYMFSYAGVGGGYRVGLLLAWLPPRRSLWHYA